MKSTAKKKSNNQNSEALALTKANMRRLFLNYCDFNKTTGSLFVSQSGCQRIFKDAKIVTKDGGI